MKDAEETNTKRILQRCKKLCPEYLSLSHRTFVLLMIIFLLMICCRKDDSNKGNEIPAPEYQADFILIPMGKFTLGEGDTIKRINYPYWIMKYDVTNYQYLLYLDEAMAKGDLQVVNGQVKGYLEGNDSFSDGYYPFYSLGDSVGNRNIGRIDFREGEFVLNSDEYLDHPVVHVTYYGALAFARYNNLDLPTEWEWEKAARGDTGYDFPWGSSYSKERCNYYKSRDPWDNGTTPVGYYNGDNGTIDSSSPYGLYDMCGNVWQWTSSRMAGTSLMIIKGGSWYKSTLYSWYKESRERNYQDNCTGFRCVFRGE